jgi:glycosyltransferase involved in cell wall biosynthesis
VVDFTVAICTYNGETRLLRVLERLRSQTGIEYFSWEVLVIDNNSTDNTAKLVWEYQHFRAPGAYSLKYFFEPKPGLAYARRRAIQEAQAPLIGFLDDDNLPTPNWVAAAYEFGLRHPEAGAYGSQIHGDYEIDPPENFQRIACFLAIVERGSHPFRYESKTGLLPAGAGLVIRKQAWLNNVPEQPILKGVCTTSLSAKGEDMETLSYIRNAGWQIWYNPQMCIYHQISRRRLERDYLLKLVSHVGLNRYPIRQLRFPRWQRPWMLSAYFVSDLRKLVISYWKNRRILKTSTVAACELELHLKSLVSPFHFWKQCILKSYLFKIFSLSINREFNGEESFSDG